jgi:type VI secretion system protein ImpM
MSAAGFFGKVRTHGDFVQRRLPTAFVTPWDESLQAGMLYARSRFGSQWLPIYLNAPMWNFVLAPGLCGESAWVGVLMPGVDRVGRYFPFTIAMATEDNVLGAWLHTAQGWFDAAAQFALSTLAPEFELEAFDERLAALSGLQENAGATPAPWRFEPACAPGSEEPLGACVAAGMTPGASAWWTEGSDAVPASLRIGVGLLDGPHFADLLDCADAAWQSVVPLRRRSAQRNENGRIGD